MTVDSLIGELSKFPKKWEVILSGPHKDVPEREIAIIIASKDELIIVKHP